MKLLTNWQSRCGIEWLDAPKMAIQRNLIKHISVVTAGRARTCRHNTQHKITKGDRLIEVSEGLYRSPKGYCRNCGLMMLEQAALNLTDLIEQLRVKNP